MALIHEECVYSIFDKVTFDEPLPPKHVSKYKDLLEKERTLGKKPIGSMGRVEKKEAPKSFPHFSNYLKKGGGFPRPRVVSDHVCFQVKLSRHATVEEAMEFDKKYEEKAKARAEINYKVKNIKEALKLQPKFPKFFPMNVDQCNGRKNRLLHSGLFPEYIYLPSFGKVPAFVPQVTLKIARAKQDKIDDRARIKSKCSYVTQSERLEMIQGLKKNWADVLNTYLRLPILIDSIPKKLRKKFLESQLKQYEKDIDTLERNPYIYVYENEN